MADAKIPDYLSDPSAVLQDTAKWRYGRAPDYTNTRNVYEKTKTVQHQAGSLPELVQNLVKNWEIEASFKMDNKDWRTIDHENHSFAVNGRPAVSAERFLELGTYNAVITPNLYYSPEHSDFASSHKTFKRMMPTFVWEVVEVYSGPPRVAFKWRHWGVMKNDYVGFNDKGEKVTAKAHGGPIEITGITIANVDSQVRMQSVETWFDPMDMFVQIAPKGIITKSSRKPMDTRDLATQLDPEEEKKEADIPNPVAVADLTQSCSDTKTGTHSTTSEAGESSAKSQSSEHEKEAEKMTINGLKKMLADFTIAFDQLAGSKHSDTNSDDVMRSSANSSWVKLGEEKGEVAPGAAVVVPETEEETRAVHEEMSRITNSECPFLNRE